MDPLRLLIAMICFQLPNSFYESLSQNKNCAPENNNACYYHDLSKCPKCPESSPSESDGSLETANL